jgi:uncharacterized membrane protein
MESNNHEYRTSFFKPANERSRANRNISLWLLIIWAVAVFGFQFALRIIEKPTPEPELVAYHEIKDNLCKKTLSSSEIQDFAKINLHVLAKVFVSKEERIILQDALNWSFFNLAGESQAYLKQEIENFEKVEANTTDILDKTYQTAKLQLMDISAPILGIEKEDIRTQILPLELRSDYYTELDEEKMAEIDRILNKYMTHNESFLTNTRFLGFPFHYFYSAVFLLILFIFLCWLYCIQADAKNKKFNIVD